MSLVAEIGTAVRLIIESKKGLVRIIDTEAKLKVGAEILKDPWH